MQARMNNPVMIIPQAMQALHALGKATEQRGVPPATVGLVQLRASQINGCSLCVDMHARDLKKAGETDDRLFAVAAWRDAPYFTDAPRSRSPKRSRASAIARIRLPTTCGTMRLGIMTRRRLPRCFFPFH